MLRQGIPMALRIEIGGRELRPPIECSAELDMLEPADAFSFSMPLDKRTADLARLDAECVVYADDTAILKGYITSQGTPDDRLEIRGVDYVGKLAQESVPGAGMLLGNVQVSSAVQRIVAPWFTKVEFSNAENRRLMRGSGRKALAGREPALTAAQRRQIPRRIDAGTKRWEALMSILEPLRLLAWSRGDGSALVVASPQYKQAPQYEFAETFAASNVIGIRPTRSIEGRYQTIEVSGSGRPPGVPAPPFFPAYPGQTRPKYVNRNRIGVATDTTGDFQRAHRLLVVSEAQSQEEAQELADRMLGMGLASADQIEVEVRGHGQARKGTSIDTLYTFDTVAYVRRDIEAGPGDDSPRRQIDGLYYITRVSYHSSREGGDTTRLTMSPVGARIT